MEGLHTWMEYHVAVELCDRWSLQAKNGGLNSFEAFEYDCLTLRVRAWEEAHSKVKMKCDDDLSIITIYENI